MRRSFLLLVVLALMAYGQYAIRRDHNDTFGTELFLIAALGAALVLGRGQPAVAEDGALTGSSNRRRRAVAGGAVACGGVVMIAAALLLSIDWRHWFAVGWLAYLGGTGVMSFGLLLFDSPTDGPGSAVRAPRHRIKPETVAVIGIFLLGLWLRFHHYDFPGPFTTHAMEEQQTGLGGFQILTAGARPWEFFVDHWLAAIALALAPEPNFAVIRIPFTVMSALTVLPVYLLLRQLVRTPAALAGTFLYSVSSWNLIYSRCAHNIFASNLFVVTVLAAIFYFGRTRRLAVLPWAGLLSGYTLYSYAGYRGTSLFVMVFLIGLVVRDLAARRRAAAEAERAAAVRVVARDATAVAIVAAIIAVVATPLFVMLRPYRGGSNYYFEAANRSLANKGYYTADTRAFLRQRVDRMRNASKIFMHVGDQSETFNSPGEPMLDPLTATCFVGGLFLAVCFPRRGFNAFLVFMFVGLMLGGTVLVQNLDVRRLQGITVFVIAFAALFLDRLWEQAHALRGGVARAAFAMIIAGAAVGTAWWNYRVYFDKMAHHPKVLETLKNQYTILIHYGQERGGDRELLLMSLIRRFFDKSYYYRAQYAWLIDGVLHGRDLGDVMDLLPPQPLPQSDRPLTAVIQKPYEGDAVARLLSEVYPGTECSNFSEPDNRYITLTTCNLPRDVPARSLTMTLEARYWKGGEVDKAPSIVRSEPFVAYAVVPKDFYNEGGGMGRAEWSGTVDVADEGDYEFIVEQRGRATAEVTLDDQPLRRGKVHLAAGPHRIRVVAQLPHEIETGVRLSWRRQGVTEVVPFYQVTDAPPPSE